MPGGVGRGTRVRPRRAVVATVTVVVVAVVAWSASLPHGGASTHRMRRRGPGAAVLPVLDAAQFGSLPRHLAAPLSREVVVPDCRAS